MYFSMNLDRISKPYVSPTVIYFSGLCMMQGLASVATAHAVQAEKGQRVLDMCAAPGGKSTALAEHMNDTGLVTAA